MAEFSPSAGNDPATAEPMPGMVADIFRIKNTIGRGGMGEVCRAQDTQLKRTVALKRLAPAWRNDALHRRRFQKEAEHASRLSDPHVAAIHDVLEDGGEIFLVMEFVEGETLRQRLARPVMIELFLDFGTQCAEALIAAHRAGIVHEPVKPLERHPRNGTLSAARRADF